MKIPKTNIRLVDVACTIGEVSSGKLVTNVSKLCSSNKINMWAKYKPVRYNFTSNRPTDWWKAENGSCGLQINYYSVANSANIQALIDRIKNGETGFSYLPPRGQAYSEPFRLGDFAGYNPAATHNIAQISYPDSIAKDTATGNARMYIAVQWIHDESMLSLTDLATNEGVYKLANWYLGALVVMPRDGTLRVVSNTTKLADMENVDVLQFEVGGQGTMYVYPILCSVTTDGKLTTGAGGYGISLPYIQELEVKCVDAHKAELEWNDSSYLRLTGSSYVATIYINYSKVQYVGDSINGYIYVCAATANGQPLGDWERIDGIYTVNLSSSSGTATLSTFAIYPNSIKGSNSESFAGYLVRFTPTSYEYASSVYGFCEV